MTTIRDIARRANVSIATVSRVLNNNATVNESIRYTVLKAAEELAYPVQNLRLKPQISPAVLVLTSVETTLSAAQGAKDGLVHVSELAARRVNKVSDVVNEGDAVKVKVIGFDDRGKVKLSMRVVDQATGADITEQVGARRPREDGEGGGDRPDRGPRRDGRGDRDRRPRREGVTDLGGE